MLHFNKPLSVLIPNSWRMGFYHFLFVWIAWASLRKWLHLRAMFVLPWCFQLGNVDLCFDDILQRYTNLEEQLLSSLLCLTCLMLWCSCMFLLQWWISTLIVHYHDDVTDELLLSDIRKNRQIHSIQTPKALDSIKIKTFKQEKTNNWNFILNVSILTRYWWNDWSCNVKWMPCRCNFLFLFIIYKK